MLPEGNKITTCGLDEKRRREREREEKRCGDKMKQQKKGKKSEEIVS